MITIPTSGVGGATYLRSRTLGELLMADIPQRQPLLDGLLREGESLLLWAATGVGKTMTALSIALAMAGGGTFLTWTAPTPRRVLYLDGEMHIGDLKDRLNDLMAAIPGLDMEAAKRNFVLLSRQDQNPTTPFPDLCDAGDADSILSRAVNDRFDVVVFDNLSVLASISDENSASAMRPVLGLLMRLKQAGVATILLHHAGKKGGTFRGSSMISTTFEVIMALKPATDAPSKYAAFDIQFDKVRAVKNDSHREKTVWLEADENQRLCWHQELSEDDVLEKMVKEVMSGRHTTQQEVATAIEVSTGQLTKLKNRAIRKGLITADLWKAAMAAARSGDRKGGDMVVPPIVAAAA